MKRLCEGGEEAAWKMVDCGNTLVYLNKILDRQFRKVDNFGLLGGISDNNA
jgi:hypothetical protein